MNNLAIGEERVYKIYGYLSYHKLIEDTERVQYDECNHDKLVEKFKYLIELPGDMSGNSYKLYKWTKAKFYYLLADPRVQNFLILESNDLRKKYGSAKSKGYEFWREKVDEAIRQFTNDNKTFTCKDIRETSGVSEKTLRRYKINEYINEMILKQANENKIIFVKKLFETAEGYLNKLREDGDSAVLSKIFEMVDTYDKYMRKNYPDATKELSLKVKEYNYELLMKKNRDELSQILDAMNELEFDNQFATKSAISKATGLSVHVIYKRLKLIE